MNASMASGVVDVCLIPEIKFKEEKLLAFVDRWVLLSLLLLASRGLGGRGAAQLPGPPHPKNRLSPFVTLYPTLYLSPISRSRSLATAS